MRYLLISLLLLISSCATYSGKQNFKEVQTEISTVNNPYFSNKSIDYVYKASIEVYDKNFGGILIVKKIEEAHHRVVFTTEMGNKIFDFSFLPDSFKINYVLEEIDKKAVINLLKKDFTALVKEEQPVIKSFENKEGFVYKTKIDEESYFYFYTDSQLSKIVQAGNRKEKIEFSFSEINDNIANAISVTHKTIDLKIELTSIIAN